MRTIDVWYPFAFSRFRCFALRITDVNYTFSLKVWVSAFLRIELHKNVSISCTWKNGRLTTTKSPVRRQRPAQPSGTASLGSKHFENINILFVRWPHHHIPMRLFAPLSLNTSTNVSIHCAGSVCVLYPQKMEQDGTRPFLTYEEDVFQLKLSLEKTTLTDDNRTCTWLQSWHQHCRPKPFVKTYWTTMCLQTCVEVTLP